MTQYFSFYFITCPLWAELTIAWVPINHVASTLVRCVSSRRDTLINLSKCVIDYNARMETISLSHQTQNLLLMMQLVCTSFPRLILCVPYLAIRYSDLESSRDIWVEPYADTSAISMQHVTVILIQVTLSVFFVPNHLSVASDWLYNCTYLARYRWQTDKANMTW